MGAGPRRLPEHLKAQLDSIDWDVVRTELDRMGRLGPPSDDEAPGFSDRVRVAPFTARVPLASGGAQAHFTLDRHADPPLLKVEIEITGTPAGP